MPEFKYAKGRIMESLAYITREMDEGESLAKFAVQRNRLAHRYLNFRWQVVRFYMENRDVLKKLINSIYKYEEGESLAKFTVQRNRLAHRYLNFRWQVVRFYMENRDVLKKLINSIYKYEKDKEDS
ncbi:MAG: hypothetical protein HY279_12430 [Nitrospinae bacterium]|nr:hypothetical protein [Nitrospinota bacterium]